MQSPLFKIEGKTGFIEHVCDDKECSCHSDPWIQQNRGKWVVELRMVDPKTRRGLKPPILLGPFESEAEAIAVLDSAKKDMEEICQENGYKLQAGQPNGNLH